MIERVITRTKNLNFEPVQNSLTFATMNYNEDATWNNVEQRGSNEAQRETTWNSVDIAHLEHGGSEALIFDFKH